MDTRLFLQINRFAKSTAFAHGFFREYAMYIGLALLGLAVILCIARATLAGHGRDTDRQIAVGLLTAVSAAVAFAINQPISHAINRPRPFLVLQGIEVLIPRAHDGGLPSDHATVAGAVIVGLWLSRDHLAAIFATVVGILLAFARVYVGAHYPTDVLAGLGLGGLSTIVIFAVFAPSVTTTVGRIRQGPASRHRALDVPVTSIGRERPNNEHEPLTGTSSGSVKLLSDHPLTPRRREPPDGTAASDVTSS